MYFFGSFQVLVDSEPALHTIDIVEKLAKFGVSTLVIPKGAGFLLNPCDAFFHSVEKKALWRQVADDPRTKNLEERAIDISNAYYSVGEDTIRHYFERCGLIGEKDSAIVSSKSNLGGNPPP